MYNRSFFFLLLRTLMVVIIHFLHYTNFSHHTIYLRTNVNQNLISLEIKN